MSYSNLLIPILVLCHLFCTTSVECVSFEEDVRITYQQKLAIDKFRSRVQPYITESFMKDDIYLVKWLRLTNFDLLQTEKKFIENIKWRKINNITTIEKEDFSDIANDYPYISTTFDRKGRPVMIAFAGDWNLRSAVITGRANRVLRYLNQGLETLSRRVRDLQNSGKQVTQASLIIELSQFSLVTHACVPCLLRIVDFLNTYESHYPGLGDKVFFVDAPPAVQFVIELIKQNVSRETRNAIQTYGTNKEQWKRALLDVIDKNNLPTELGGNLERN